MKTTTFIYALTDPRTNEVRYVGKAGDPERRIKEHLWDKRNCHRVWWIKKLARLGLKPRLLILEEVSLAEWPPAEQRWIKHFRDIGVALTNATDGGEGTVNVNLSIETRARMSVSAHNRPPMSHETRAKLSAAHKGRKKSPEMCAKLGASHVGLKHTPEARAKMSAANTGRKHTLEARAKIAAALRVRVISSETGAKISAAKMGHTVSLETRAKISATKKAGMTDERKRAISELLMGHVASAEQRAKISASLKAYHQTRKANPDDAD